MQVDSKKELERALKAGCEAFIMGATKLAVDDMLSFITKVTAVRVAASPKPLREQVGHACHGMRGSRAAGCLMCTDCRARNSGRCQLLWGTAMAGGHPT